MCRHTRRPKALGPALAVAGLLLVWAPAAEAEDTRPKPPPVNLLSATVEGCQAPCAPDESGEVTVSFEKPVRPEGVPSDAFINVGILADGVGVHWFTWNDSGDPWRYTMAICAEGQTSPYGCRYNFRNGFRGDEEMTVVVSYYWDCDPIFGNCASSSQRSDPSNALVPTQL
jgi:hypothetical protein